MPVSDMDKIIPLWDAIQVHRHEYDSGDTDYSVTTLLSPPRVVHLNKRHIHKVDLWVEDLLHSWTGTASHNYLEYCLGRVKEGNRPKYRLEERLRTVIEGRKISGAYDVLWNKKMSLWDMKNTSTWKVVFGNKHEWTAQQNMYAYLWWKEYQTDIKQLNIIGLFRDWSLANLFRSGKDYPRKPAVRIRLPIWDYNKTYNYMEERVTILKAEENTADDDLPLCTWEDMWCKPDQVAVESTRLKRALRVCDDMKAAEDWVAQYLMRANCKDKVAQLSYNVRPSVRTRCESWCPINIYCNQYQDYLKALATGGK